MRPNQKWYNEEWTPCTHINHLDLPLDTLIKQNYSTSCVVGAELKIIANPDPSFAIQNEEKYITHQYCPNMCMNGKEKYYPNPERVLWEYKQCSCCKGQSIVTIEQGKLIEKTL